MQPGSLHQSDVQFSQVKPGAQWVITLPRAQASHKQITYLHIDYLKLARKLFLKEMATQGPPRFPS